MFAPTEQFSYLSLPDNGSDLSEPGNMRFNETSVARRKEVVQDIFASFDGYFFASEYKREDFEKISEEQGHGEPTAWTIPDSLEKTMMGWAVHNLQAWTLLNKIRTPRERAVLFAQKLRRRFKDQFGRYEQAENAARSSLRGDQVRLQVDRIRDDIGRLVRLTNRDLNIRLHGGTEGWTDIATELLRALRTICQQDDDLGPPTPPTQVRRSGRTSAAGSEHETSLYHRLIEHGRPRQGDSFMLDVLRFIREKSPRTFASDDIRRRLQEISTLISRHHGAAANAYRTRLQQLIPSTGGH